MNPRLAAALGPPLVRILFRTLGASYRYRLVRPERLERLLAGGPAVVTLWHEQAFAAAGFALERVHRAGLPLTVIASQSRDGELVARLLGPLRVPVVRGSTSRGGRGAILALYRALARERSSPVLLPDGPRGPRRVAKAGAVLLAQFGRAPIVPLAFAARRAYRLGSWDRMVVPWPWARVEVSIGEPIAVPRELGPDGLERERLRLEAALEAASAEAEAAALGDAARDLPAGGRASRVRAGGSAASAGEAMHEKKPV